jgi:hypothetical protein
MDGHVTWIDAPGHEAFQASPEVIEEARQKPPVPSGNAIWPGFAVESRIEP